MANKSRIIGIGSYLPKRVLSNQDLEKMVDTSDEWIFSRTGMKERRIAEPEEATSDMGAAAARKALEEAGRQPEDLDLILVATMTPDFLSSSTAAIIQYTIGATRAAAMDIQAACSGFPYVLSVAKAYIESGMYRTILVIASEKMSAFIDYQDRNTCVLFGDGASAAVVTAEGSGLLLASVCLGANGQMAELINVPAGGSRNPTSENTVRERQHYMRMQGREVFKQAVRYMGTVAQQCLDQANISKEKLDWLVPHQANERIVDAIVKSLGLPPERVFKTIHKYGNTSASSIGIALDELLQSQKIPVGKTILLLAFGAGLTWGAVLLIKEDAA